MEGRKETQDWLFLTNIQSRQTNLKGKTKKNQFKTQSVKIIKLLFQHCSLYCYLPVNNECSKIIWYSFLPPQACIPFSHQWEKPTTKKGEEP